MTKRMAEGTVHIVGAGLAGLSTAVRLAGRGRRVVLHEANRFAGGRCRTFHDPRLEREIDNGNHLSLSGNRAARADLAAIVKGTRAFARQAGLDHLVAKDIEVPVAALLARAPWRQGQQCR